MSKNETNQKRISYMSFLWNAVYAGLNAIQSAVILFAVSRTQELSEAGIITIGFTLASLAMIIGRYGIRNFQVTDVHEEYSFSDYFHVRVITVAVTFLLFVLFLAGMLFTGKYTLHKGCIILELIALKMVDAFEGLYVGRLQQKGRLDIGARIAAIRLGCSTAVVFMLLWFINSIPVCLGIGIIVSVVLDCVLLPGKKQYASFSVASTDKKKVKKLLMITLPLCIGTALHNYIGNAPKYLVDFFMSDEMQAISGYIMMPMFVITLLNTFLMQPTVKKLGDAWDAGDRVCLRNMVFRHICMLMSASVLVLVAGIFIGLPILSLLYKVELGGYQLEFGELMIGGTLYTLSAYFIVVLTTMRKQIWIIAGCIASVMTYILLGKSMVESEGFTGASVLYIIANAIMLLVFLGSIYMTWKKAFNGGTRSC